MQDNETPALFLPPPSPVQIQPLNMRAITDLRFDRFFFGPGSWADLEVALIGWPAGAEGGILVDGQLAKVDPTTLDGLEEGEMLLLPGQPNAIHRGGVRGLADVVERLLDPNGGCPWDLEQTHETLKKYLIEEAYELIEAIDQADDAAMIEELGDVLLQPMMHAGIAAKERRFSIESVGQAVAEKLVRRHPHVFGDATAADAEQVLKNWDVIKEQEKNTKSSILEGIPASMPALGQAHQISKRAARAGFEWPDLDGVFAKMDEEITELKEAIAKGVPEEIEAEIGDVLFTLVNVARWLKVDAEESLRKMLRRFTARFAYMEANSPQPLADLSPEAWDELWNAAKAQTAN